MTVEIETDDDLEAMAARALQLFRDAGGWPDPSGPAVGFSQAERRSTAPVQPSSSRWAPGPYPVQAP